jgi:hypothetical protein
MSGERAREVVARLLGGPNADALFIRRIRNEAADIITSQEAEIEALRKKSDDAALGKQVCVARLEILTGCGIAEVALSNPTIMRQWGEMENRAITAERLLAEAERVIRPFAEFAPQAEHFVSVRAAAPGRSVFPTKHFRLSDFVAARTFLENSNGK